MMPTRRLCLIIVALAWALPAAAKPGRAVAEAGIATAHPLATQAGEEVMAAGGNAFDAAVAISAALAVVEPFASGLGGGAFWLLHEAKGGKQTFVDAREVAPGAATRDMYLDEHGEAAPRRHAQRPPRCRDPGPARRAGAPGEALWSPAAEEVARARDPLSPRRAWRSPGAWNSASGSAPPPRVTRPRWRHFTCPVARPSWRATACATRIWRTRCGRLQRMAGTASTADVSRSCWWMACAPPAESGRWRTWPGTKSSSASRSAAASRT